MSQRGDLPERMRELAEARALPADHPLRTLADELDAAVIGFYSADQTHTVAQFVGAWARARKIWCEHTGEPLI